MLLIWIQFLFHLSGYKISRRGQQQQIIKVHLNGIRFRFRCSILSFPLFRFLSLLLILKLLINGRQRCYVQMFCVRSNELHDAGCNLGGRRLDPNFSSNHSAPSRRHKQCLLNHPLLKLTTIILSHQQTHISIHCRINDQIDWDWSLCPQIAICVHHQLRVLLEIKNIHLIRLPACCRRLFLYFLLFFRVLFHLCILFIILIRTSILLLCLLFLLCFCVILLSVFALLLVTLCIVIACPLSLGSGSLFLLLHSFSKLLS
mmetsp:Transcript_60814/g.96648  ORF Transcript_60814/g.96648 Transcript_60814/m.96648 type:complete len:259 (+) Transcript_60814:95-871(+)